MHYDGSGHSLGTATMYFQWKANPLKVLREYYGVPLDGCPLSIQVVTLPRDIPKIPTPSRNGGGLNWKRGSGGQLLAMAPGEVAREKTKF